MSDPRREFLSIGIATVYTCRLCRCVDVSICRISVTDHKPFLRWPYGTRPFRHRGKAVRLLRHNGHFRHEAIQSASTVYKIS